MCFCGIEVQLDVQEEQTPGLGDYNASEIGKGDDHADVPTTLIDERANNDPFVRKKACSSDLWRA